ncbi:hypothetical protein MY10362_001024 [Beauveria mimosiformis]
MIALSTQTEAEAEAEAAAAAAAGDDSVIIGFPVTVQMTKKPFDNGAMTKNLPEGRY